MVTAGMVADFFTQSRIFCQISLFLLSRAWTRVGVPSTARLLIRLEWTFSMHLTHLWQFLLVCFYMTNIISRLQSGLPWSGKNTWKMKFFPGQGKVRELGWWPGKFRKDLESQGNVREFENKWLWLAVFRKFIYSVQKGKGYTFSSDSLSPFSSS